MKVLHVLVLILLASALLLCPAAGFAAGNAAADPLLSPADEIRQEATLPTIGPFGHPLPLAAHWNTGGQDGSGNEWGIGPAAQLKLIEEGHYLLPWFAWPSLDNMHSYFHDEKTYEKWYAAQLPYFVEPLRKAAKLKLPISLLATQWESELTYDKKYLNAPAEQNPNVVDINGKILQEVDPFGPVGPWKEVGSSWTNNRGLLDLQTWYPDPPLVILISNNEHAKLWWWDAEQSKRFMDLYGKGRDDNFKRKVIADGWIERYRALQKSMRESLDSPTWRKNALFMGYEASGPPHFGREMSPETWQQYSSYSPGRIDVGPLTWDGSSPSYYLHNWMPIYDYKVWSPQVEAMNWVFMNRDAYKVNPKFWFELSTWDGDVGDQPNNKRKTYAAMGQALTPERYEGMIQFGMWLLRPRAVRDFRGYNELSAAVMPYFVPIMDAVDRVHTNPTLRRFWRQGELVPNHGHLHPYQKEIPVEYQQEDRWFLLDTNLDAPWPWTQSTEIPVYSLALVMGKAPEREWLVFTHAPKSARIGVQLTVPEYGPITVDSSQTGSFYLVSEKTKKVTPVVEGGPTSVNIALKSAFVKTGEKVDFTATDAYAPGAKLTRFTWDFGDGKEGRGARVQHAYQQPGQYAVLLTADGHGCNACRTATVFAGIGPEDGLVLHYLLKKVPGEMVPDASGREHRGFLYNGQYVDDPQRGNVLELTGKGYLGIMNTTDINTAPKITDRTLSLWFKAVDVTKRQMLFEEGGPGNGLNLYLEGGKLHAGMWISQFWKGGWVDSGAILPGQWYHVAVLLKDAGETPSPDKLALYVNGAKIASGTAMQLTRHMSDINLGRNGDTLYPGGPAGSPSDYFAGRLDNFAIYNRALSEAEIARLAK